MEPRELVAAARAAGATLQPEGVSIRAAGLAALPPGLAAALRRHRDEVHVWLSAEAAVLPDDADALARRELGEPEDRPGAGYQPGDRDPLRDGLLAGFAPHHCTGSAARRAGPRAPAR